MLTTAEQQRRDVAAATPRSHKSAMGQFMTPAATATFMAGLFEPRSGPFRLLDAGAGLGALACAVLDRWKSGALGEGAITVDAYELDERLRTHLTNTLAGYEAAGVEVSVHGGDFLDAAATQALEGQQGFTHAILNPPYKKISTTSDARDQARRAGLETVNLYSAFVGLALERLEPGGQLVAIIPRSFCNGPYYKPFRQYLFARGAVQHIHLFDSRNQAFRDDAVLQENVILLIERGANQGPVRITHSTDDRFADVREQVLPFAAIVKPGDRECFIHIPGEHADPIGVSPLLTHTLEDLGISVSTGPVVDFRMRQYLLAMPRAGSVPLLYAHHFQGAATVWPVEGSKKSNAIWRNDETEKWLYPCGTYVAVRRFSSKEEKRRVVAGIVDPEALGNPARIGLENHLNVYHARKQGLDPDLAHGLFVYLNSTILDEHLRRFSGHTQVNATDLKNIRYPSREALVALGAWARQHGELAQSDIDGQMETLL